jgi:hypothetical protein
MIFALGAALIVPSVGQAGDKSQSTMVNPVVTTGTAFPPASASVGTSWVNGTSKGKTKGDTKCKVQIQLKGLSGLPDSDGVPGSGDEVICVTHAHVNVDPGGGNILTDTSSIFRGELSNGSVKIKVDLAAEGTGCLPEGSAFPLAQYGSDLTCYEPDFAYLAAAECAAAAGIWIPFLSGPSQGVCTFVPPGGVFIAPPGTPIIATNGIFFKP